MLDRVTGGHASVVRCAEICAGVPYTRPIASPEFQNDEALKKNCRGERSLVLVTLSNAPLNPVI